MKTKTGIFDLDQMLAPLGAKKFFDEKWPDQFFVHHGNIERLSNLIKVPELLDLDKLARSYKRKATLWCSSDKDQEFYNRVHGKNVDSQSALGFYSAGATIYFTEVDQEIPALREITRQVEKDLKINPGTARCEMFASKEGFGTPPHFDHDINFNIQLCGTKTWKVAPNKVAPHPLSHYKIVEGKPTGELAHYWQGGPIKAMPEPSQSFDAGPGALSFIPQGYWHSTVTKSDSLAISFVIIPPAWIDLLMKLIRRNLVSNEFWRRRAIPRRSTKENLGDLKAALATASDELRKLTADDLLEMERLYSADTFDANRKISFDLKENRTGGTSEWILHVHHDEQESGEVTIHKVFLPLIRWILDRKEPFTNLEALANAGIVQRGAVDHILSVLVDQKVLNRLPGF